MKATLISAALLAALVSADTTTTAAAATTTCAAQAILDACLDTTEGYLVLCSSQDYSCLCDKYNSIMTCFANCPYDDRQYAISSERDLYCMNASAYQTKTTTNSWTKASTTATAHATTTESSESSEATEGASSTYGGGEEETTTGSSPLATGGANIEVGSSGLLAALAGVAVAALV